MGCYCILTLTPLLPYIPLLQDGPGLASDFLSLGFLPPETPKEAVEDALAVVFKGSSRRLDFTGALTELSGVMRKFRFQVPPHFALVIRALGALEGTVIKVKG